MSTRITDSNVTTEINSRLNSLRQITDSRARELSTGLRVHLPSDDPEAIGRSLGFKVDETKLAQFQENVNRAKDIATSTAMALQEMDSIISRSQEIAGRTNDQLSIPKHSIFSTEVNGLLDQIFSSGNRDYLGEQLFGGTITDTPSFTAVRDGNNKITSVAYVGNSDKAEASISPTIKLSAHADGATNNKILAAMNAIMALRDALDATDPAAVATAQTGALLTATGDMAESVAKTGSIMNRIETADFRNELDIRENQKNIGREINAAFEESMAQYKQAFLAFQASSQVYSTILNNRGLLDFL